VARARGVGPLPHPSRERRALTGQALGKLRKGAGRLAVGWAALTAWGFFCPRTTPAQDSTPQAKPDSAAVVVLKFDSLPLIRLESDPAPVTEGRVGWLYVSPPTGALTIVVGGRAAGEPLHFDRALDGRYRALIGVPIEPGDSLPVSIYLARGEWVDTLTMAIAVRRAGYPRERLAVAPAFVRPDSAAAARIRRELVRSREVSRRSQETVRLWEGAFRLPRPSRITSAFGSARVYNDEVKSRHLGTDFAGAVGAPVYAAGRGVVALVADFYLAGRAVYIDHGGGLITTYFHLSRAEEKWARAAESPGPICTGPRATVKSRWIR
jgi:hypothetical protein